MTEAKADKEAGKKRKWHWKELLAVIFLIGATFFFWQQRKELATLGKSLQHTNLLWLSVGIAFTVVYVLLQAALYIYSFYAVGANISLKDAIELFLRRNVIAVFLPGGGLTALAYVPTNIKSRQQNPEQVHHASVIYGFIGIFSVFIVAIPVLMYLTLQETHIPGMTAGFITMLVMLVAIVVFIRSVQVRGKFYSWAIRKRPKVETFLNEVFTFDLIWKQFWYAVIVSVFIEVVGVIHLYISMLAAGVPGSLTASIVGYIVATIFLIISPFLRGLGAIEMSLTFILKGYGYSTVHAFQISLLFRLFEFWLPLIAGLFYYADKGRKLLSRLLPTK